MHAKVRKYLNTYYSQKAEAEEAEKQRVLISLGLYTLEDIEVEKQDGYDYIKKIDGEKHYFLRKQVVPVPVTDKEYAEILETLPESERHPAPFEEETEDTETDGYEDNDDSSVCVISVIFMIAASILWVGGVAFSYFLSKNLLPGEEFALPVFLISSVVFLLAGCAFWHASAVQKKLFDIRDLLEEIIDGDDNE